MQAGLAILTNNLDYVKHLVADFECGLWYDSADVRSFVTAVNRFCNDPEYLQRCRRNARIKVAEVFNWEVQSRELFETCDRLLNAPAPEMRTEKAA
jgi:glycosyltransferase involved in cell wall biosynthesis